VKQGGLPERVATDEAGPATESGKLSKDGSLLIVSAASVAHMPRTAVFRAEGGKAGDLPSVAVEPPLNPQLEIRKVGPGEGFWTSVLRPHGFVPGKKLPVVLEVYGGPGYQQVVHSMRENLLSQWMADQGYLVVKLDGRGTPRRGRAWERAIKNDFSLTLEDQVAGLKALAKEVPELDLTRVGVTGWSFGGYLAALATLSRPDVFKSGIAGAPVVDWADYDTHYTERYLGTPEGDAPGYEKSSLLTYVSKLERPLLLIHGTADDNVYFFHTLKLSDALFRAGKVHQVLPLSNFTHMVPEPLVTQRLNERIARFFKDTL
jgi:dipeptidyl-peptidase-4